MNPWFMFWFKKLVAEFFYPLPVALILLVVGCVLLWLKKHECWAKGLVTGSAVILFVCGLPWLPRLLIQPVESRFTPVLHPNKLVPAGSHPAVVVLGMGFNPNPQYPLAMRVSAGMWVRILEGVRLHEALPGSRLIISLSGNAGKADKETFADRLCRFLHLRRDHVQLITKARNTADEARLAAGILRPNARCFLVTEALYMRRALLTFKEAGIDPIPAPCGYILPKDPSATFTVLDLVPAPEALVGTRQGIHELLGTIWQDMMPSRKRPAREQDKRGSAAPETPARPNGVPPS